MQATTGRKIVLCLGIALALATSVAHADRRPPGAGGDSPRKESKKSADEANKYPHATRVDPKTSMPGGIGTKLNKVNDLQDESPEKAQALIDDVLGDKKLTPYAQAYALYLRSNIKWEADDGAGAIADLKQALDLDALPNSIHLPAMYLMAQFQLQEEKYAEAVASIDRYITLSGDNKPEALAIKGNALYRMEKFPESIEVMKAAIAASDKPQESWNQILMASYFELDQYGEAAKISEAQLAKNPNDKKVLQQLASIYINGEQPQKALALLTDAKARGLITTSDDYKLLAQLYGQADKPAEGAALLEEGFKKGAIQPSFEMYKLLGDSYANADKEAEAVEAYGKASPLAKDGEADFLRGQYLINMQRWADAKEAMTKAIQRGVRRQGAAHVLLGNAENELGNKAAAIAAMEKARGDKETAEMAQTWLKMIKGGGTATKKK